jgi:hypothetical protein
MIVNSPEPPDIYSFMEQFNSVAGHLPDVPDWFWQGMTVWAVGWAAGKAIEWTFKHRKQIFDKLGRNLKPIVISMNPFSLTVEAKKIAVSDDFTLIWNTRSTVGSERQALWNLEASTLPERVLDEGLELVS